MSAFPATIMEGLGELRIVYYYGGHHTIPPQHSQRCAVISPDDAMAGDIANGHICLVVVHCSCTVELKQFGW